MRLLPCSELEPARRRVQLCAGATESPLTQTHTYPQAALFALAVADVLLVNIWCHDIGREQGSGKPLMKTIFQVRLKDVVASDRE